MARWRQAFVDARIYNTAYVEEIVDLISTGGDPGIPLTASPISCRKNHTMDLRSKLATTSDILQGVGPLGFVIGPFLLTNPITKDWVYSPLGALWKPGRPKVRLIHDLSHGKRIQASVSNSE